MPASYDVYKLSENLGVAVNSLYSLSNGKKRNYAKKVIKKQNGGERVLYVPGGFLKYVQRELLEKYLYYLPVSDYACAYVRGRNVLDNARVHVGNKKILKMDIQNFFDSVTAEKVYAVFKDMGLDRAATGLITELCTYEGSLPQGAPTSPHIANLVMCEFDETVGRLCNKEKINYTRYCDDMTFSGDFDEIALARKIEGLLYYRGFVVNSSKTKSFDKSRSQQVTGVTVNSKPSLSRAKRREIRSEVYYCCKYGVDSRVMEKSGMTDSGKYFNSLLGRIAFALQINPKDNEMKKCFEDIKKLKKSLIY